MTSPLIVVQDLHKTFFHLGRELHVLKGIDLTIDQGHLSFSIPSAGLRPA